MLSTLKSLKHRLYLCRKTKRRASRLKRLRQTGVTIGEGTYVHPTVDVLPGARIGADCWLNRDVFVDCAVQVGDHVYIEPRVTLCTATHEIGPSYQRAGANVEAPIAIGKGSWLGQNVSVIAGVTIGNGCMIAAGAVVVHDYAPHGVYAGIPARRIKDLSEGNNDSSIV